MSEECTHDCSTCGSSCEHVDAKDLIAPLNKDSSIKHVYAIMSGKGGVGKSSTTASLATAMAKRGYKVGIMDADITGPSIPTAFGLDTRAVGDGESIFPELTPGGIKIISLNLLLENKGDPVVWRGSLLGGVVKQFWTDVRWGELDYLFIDMPPGTGDVPLTVFQSIPVDGIVVVTSPQDLVSLIVTKAVRMAEMMNKPILGVVENYSYFQCPNCGEKHYIFGKSNLEQVAAELQVKVLAQIPMDPAMAAAIGYALQAPPLVLFSLIAVGSAANGLGGAGGPLAVLVIAILAAEIGKAVSKETKVDILVTPLVTICAGVALSAWWAPAIGAAASAFGQLIKDTTVLQPFWMGIVVSVLVGIALTLPISSAAICAAFGLTGLAGGAAVAGCCAQMVGFAVMSYRENGVGGLVSQGLGTSMLQMGNIIKNPRIWIAPTLASAITGPLATCLFHFEMNGAAVSSGMGTCGLVGQIGVYTGWISDIAAGTKAAITPMDWAAMILLCFVLPAVLSVLFCEAERKLGWIKDGDLKLN